MECHQEPRHMKCTTTRDRCRVSLLVHVSWHARRHELGIWIIHMYSNCDAVIRFSLHIKSLGSCRYTTTSEQLRIYHDFDTAMPWKYTGPQVTITAAPWLVTTLVPISSWSPAAWRLSSPSPHFAASPQSDPPGFFRISPTVSPRGNLNSANECAWWHRSPHTHPLGFSLKSHILVLYIMCTTGPGRHRPYQRHKLGQKRLYTWRLALQFSDHRSLSDLWWNYMTKILFMSSYALEKNTQSQTNTRAQTQTHKHTQTHTQTHTCKQFCTHASTHVRLYNSFMMRLWQILVMISNVLETPRSTCLDHVRS